MLRCLPKTWYTRQSFQTERFNTALKIITNLIMRKYLGLRVMIEFIADEKILDEKMQSFLGGYQLHLYLRQKTIGGIGYCFISGKRYTHSSGGA